MRIVRLAACAAVVCVMVASCALFPGRGEGRASPEGTAWELVLLEGTAPIDGTTITLRFAESTVAGSAGCNTYGGSYRVKADGLQFGDVYATEMGCMEPEGVLEQEQAYLGVLRAVAAFELRPEGLALADEVGTERLTFVPEGQTASDPVAPRTATPAATVSPTPTEVPPTPTATAAPRIPDGWYRYADPETGISLLLPETWTVTPRERTSPVTIVQSYPEGTYVGGEPFRPGDTKCDLWIHPPKTRAATLVERYDTDPDVIVVSQEQVVLESGDVGTRTEANAMGPSVSMITEVNGRAVTFVCYGDLTPFDGIAVTLAGGM